MPVDRRTCSICKSASTHFASATILGRHDIEYVRCGTCGFVQTETPYWLDEAYSSAIAASDVGLVARNLAAAALTQATIGALFDSDGRFLDYGGGYGLLVRLMRDRGFDFFRDDPLCENLFAQGFDRADGRYELVTAFEVFEHLTDPVAGAATMLEHADSVLFSTLLLPDPAPLPGTWWYYALETGQHVSLYTPEALRALAEQLGVHVASSRRRDVHIITRSRHTAKRFPLVSLRRTVPWANRLRRSRQSLVPVDYERVTGHPPV